MTKVSYNSHYRNCCPGPVNGQMSVKAGPGQGRFALQGTERLLQVLQRPETSSGPGLPDPNQAFNPYIKHEFLVIEARKLLPLLLLWDATTRKTGAAVGAICASRAVVS